MNRETIIAEIKRTAQINGGRPLGSRKFESETGIKSTVWLGKIWARWKDALQDAGFAPNQLVVAHNKDFLFEIYAKISSENKKLVTKNDMRLINRNGSDIPDWNTFHNHFGNKINFIKELSSYLSSTNTYEDVLDMCVDYKDKEIINEEIVLKKGIPVTEFVYLLKSGKFYKIGRTNSVGRRQYEISVQMPEEVIEIHRISTDDSIGIERYWHQRFMSKRVKGEWFNLSREEVDIFKLRKFM